MVGTMPAARVRGWCRFGAELPTGRCGGQMAAEDDLRDLQGFMRMAEDGSGSLRDGSPNFKTVCGAVLLSWVGSTPMSLRQCLLQVGCVCSALP